MSNTCREHIAYSLALMEHNKPSYLLFLVISVQQYCYKFLLLVLLFYCWRKHFTIQSAFCVNFRIASILNLKDLTSAHIHLH